jgi:Asp/Glu/hydantoin racemase
MLLSCFRAGTGARLYYGPAGCPRSVARVATVRTEDDMAESQPRVGVIHATPAAMDPVRAAFAAELPAAKTLHFLDEGLIDGVARSGGVTPALVRRLATVVGQADSAGVQIILTTCSAYSPVMDTMRALCSVPIITIDEVLFEEAARAADHLGVIAASESSLRTTVQGLRDEAARQGRDQRYTTTAVPEAFAALGRDDVAAAAAIVAAAARRLIADGAGAIMLAQASLSRTLPLLGDLGVPVLTSPSLAVQRVAAALAAS